MFPFLLPPPMRIESSSDAASFNVTHRWLRDHNARYVSEGSQPVYLFAYDNDDQIVGSLDGQIYWRKLHIDNLVVRPDRRNAGIGSALMSEAEAIARRHNCTGVYLETMSFQAIGFYRKIGYQLFGTLEGFDNDTVKYFLHKPMLLTAEEKG